MNVLNNNKIPWENVFEYATEDLSMYLWSLESWIDPPDGYDQEYILLLILNSRARSRSAISLIKENIPPEHYQNRDQLNILWQKGEKLLYNFIETNYEDIEKIINDKFVKRISQLEQDLNNIKRIAQDGDLMDDPEWVQDDLNEIAHDFLLQFQNMANSNEEIQSEVLKAVNLEKFTDNFKQNESLFKEYFGYFNPVSDFLIAIKKREYNKNQWWLNRYPDPDDIKEEEVSDELLQTMISTFQKEGQKLELDCPQSDNAIDYAFGELSADENKLFHDHMLECRYCFDLVQDTRMAEIESKELDKKHVKVLPALEEALKSQKQDSLWNSLINKLKDFAEQMSFPQNPIPLLSGKKMNFPQAAVSLVTAGMAAIIISYSIYFSGPAKFNINLKVIGGIPIRAGGTELKEFDLKNGDEIDSDNKIRIIAKIDKAAFVYIISYDSLGNINLINKEVKTTVKTLVLPSKNHWYPPNYKSGDEAIYLIASKRKIKDIEARVEKLRKSGIDNINKIFKKAKIETFRFSYK